MEGISQPAVNELTQAARSARLSCLKMARHADKEGAHLGGAFSCIEILVVLYRYAMHIDPKNLSDENRDRFIFSKGHGAPALYAVMAGLGIFSEDEVMTFKDSGSVLTGHPARNPDYGIEFSTGSLGQGLSLGVGSCLGMQRKSNKTSRVFVLLGDGECDEGSIWEAAMAASHYQLSNLTVIVDANGLQYDGAVGDVMSLGALTEKWRAFGWDTYEVDGHSISGLCSAFDSISLRKQSGKPAVIIANTIKGKGISFMEGNRAWHHNRLTETLYQQALEELGVSL